MTTDQLQAQLDTYAEILVRVGVNVQPGQPVIIGAGREFFFPLPESAGFIRTLARKAYDAGASYVHVEWSDAAIARLAMEHASMEELSRYPSWQTFMFSELVKEGAAFIRPYSPDPGLYGGLPTERISAASRAESEGLKDLSEAFGANTVQWVIAALATSAWARLMFPDLPEDEGLRELWGLILRACRADTSDPIRAWQEHIAALGRRGEQLESHAFRRLHYRAPGTDLHVELPRDARWLSGGGTSRGVPVVVNIPTEEVFTAPHRTGVDGTVRSTLPLSHAGILVENIALRFEGGRIVEASADSGEDVLLGSLDTDERSRYLGELALVPVDSPLATLNKVFYNTLYDENASCHLAIGSGYPESIPGGESLGEDELLARGINQSKLHLDFMIGSDELDIDGETQSGETIPVFRGGRWALP